MSRRAALAFAASMIGAVAVAVVTRDAAWLGAAGFCVLGARAVGSRGRWTPSGRFGLANTLTLVRLALVSALPLFCRSLPAVAFAALTGALFALDALDGRIARARGEASSFGAAFDMETDALSIMMLALLLWLTGRAPAWVLAAGLWRYAYVAMVALVPSLGEAPRSQFARVVFAAAALALTLAFVPPLPARPLAALATILVSLSFLRSLAYSKAR